MNWLNGKKTYIVSVLMGTISLVQLMTGELTLVEFLSSSNMTTFFEALGLTTLRAGIQQNQKDTSHEIFKNIHFPHAG